MKTKTKTEIIPIERIVLDKSIYPRTQVEWVTIARYKGAMIAGANFPPVVVARFRKKFLVIDGFHRIEARKQLKETHIAVEVLEGLNKKEMFVESVQRNIGHGRQFSGYERTQIVLTLQKWKVSQKLISEIVRLPVDYIEPYIAKRSVRITGTNEIIPLKQPVMNMAESEVSESFEQEKVTGRSQIQLLDSLICILENNYVDTNSELVMEKLKKISVLLEKYQLTA